MEIEDVLKPGPPLRPREVARLLEIPVSTVKKLLRAHVVRGRKMPCAGQARYARWIILREDVAQLARDVGQLRESLQTAQPNSESRQAAPCGPSLLEKGE